MGNVYTLRTCFSPTGRHRTAAGQLPQLRKYPCLFWCVGVAVGNPIRRIKTTRLCPDPIPKGSRPDTPHRPGHLEELYRPDGFLEQ